MFRSESAVHENLRPQLSQPGDDRGLRFQPATAMGRPASGRVVLAFTRRGLDRLA